MAMAVMQGDEANEVLKAEAHIWNHVFNFINSMSLKCAVQLGIPDIVHSHGHPMTLSQLVAALSIAPARAAHVGRIMRLLVHSGFFALQKINSDQGGDEEGYVLTPPSRLLLKDTATCMSPLLLLTLDPVVVTPWHFLSTWLVGDDPTAFQTAHGMGMWDHMAQNPKFHNLFNEAMASDAQIAMSIVVKECGLVFQGLRSLVDVGGSTGTATRAIANAFPHVKCTVFDLPHVIASVPKSKNVEMVGGDMFESIPCADAVFLKWILHDWSDEECLKILRRCKEAIPSKEEGGKVIILDMVVNMKNGDYKSTETQFCFDLLMLVLFGGKERGEHEWRKIFIDAGFTHYKISPVLGMRSIIEWILHDWADDECVKILKRCKEAIPSKEDGGKLIILEMVMNADADDDKTKETKLCFDVMMMVLTPGKQRDKHEWQKIFIYAGVSHSKIIPVLGFGSIIEVYP